jgi:hypothetical protein
MSVKERLIVFAKSHEKSVRAFEVKSGLTIGYVNAIRVSIQPDKIQSIVSHYPDLNTGWLMTGEGEMLKSESIISGPIDCLNCLSLQKELEMKDAMIKLQQKLIAEYEFQLGKKKNSNCG